MKKLFIMLTLLSFSCNKLPLPGAVRMVQVQINLVDDQDESVLLNPLSGYTYDAIKLYYINSSMEYIRLYEGNLDNPDFLQLNEDGSITIDAVFGEQDGNYVSGGRATTYIDFGNGDVDTLQVTGPNNESTQVIEKVWYNDLEKVLGFNADFEVIKN